MYSFVICVKPKSYNSWVGASTLKKTNYKKALENAFRRNYGSHIPAETELYGLVYHFFRSDIGIDADNLSKPIWDCLTGILYFDDKQIKLRIAGSFDLTRNDLTTLDLSGLSGAIIAELSEALQTQEHVLYVECGSFNPTLITLNMEGNGN